jgi:hypothetical protein
MAKLLLRLQLEMEAARAGAATAPSSQPNVFDQPGELPLPLGDEILPEILQGLPDDLARFVAASQAHSSRSVAAPAPPRHEPGSASTPFDLTAGDASGVFDSTQAEPATMVLDLIAEDASEVFDFTQAEPATMVLDLTAEDASGVFDFTQAEPATMMFDLAAEDASEVFDSIQAEPEVMVFGLADEDLADTTAAAALDNDLLGLLPSTLAVAAAAGINLSSDWMVIPATSRWLDDVDMLLSDTAL